MKTLPNTHEAPLFHKFESSWKQLYHLPAYQLATTLKGTIHQNSLVILQYPSGIWNKWFTMKCMVKTKHRTNREESWSKIFILPFRRMMSHKKLKKLQKWRTGILLDHLYIIYMFVNQTIKKNECLMPSPTMSTTTSEIGEKESMNGYLMLEDDVKGCRSCLFNIINSPCNLSKSYILCVRRYDHEKKLWLEIKTTIYHQFDKGTCPGSDTLEERCCSFSNFWSSRLNEL